MIKNFLKLVIINFLLPMLALGQCVNPDTDRNNLGIFGGTFNDIAFSRNTDRLFGALETPASVFITDDTGSTWYKAFPLDSLSFNCGTNGWGGGATKILTNNKGWVAAYTQGTNGIMPPNISVSFSNGDTGSWKTASTTLSALGLYPDKNPTGMGLNDYFLFNLLGTYIVKQGSSTSKVIVNVADYISGINTESRIRDIAIANNSNSYPLYFVLDTSSQQTSYGLLYQFNGSSFVKMNLPTSLTYISNVFTPLEDTDADTIFISGPDKNNNGIFKIYKSFDGGSNWVDITPTNNNQVLQKVLYSSKWGTNKIILVIGDGTYSTDLGVSWAKDSNEFTKIEVSPNNKNNAVGAGVLGIYHSPAGLGGTYSLKNNFGLEAIKINQIVRSPNKGIFYLATESGLAYTTAYKDSTVSSNLDKWKSPHGEFPVTLPLSSPSEVTSIAMNPFDSLHVICGVSQVFYVSFTGVNGFSKIYTSISTDELIEDIKIVNSTIVFATTRSWSNQSSGDILYSNDGGLSWQVVTPSGFCCGNTISVGYSSSDTVVYIGSGLDDKSNGSLWKWSTASPNWVKINDGPNSTVDFSVTKMAINDIAVDVRGTDTLYLVCSGGDNVVSEVIKSYDGGTNFQFISGLDLHKVSTAVSNNISNPDQIYFAMDEYLYFYDNKKDSLDTLWVGLPGEETKDIAIGSILVGTTTGFYTFHPTWEDIATNLQDMQNNSNALIVNVYPNPFEDEAILRITLKEDNSNLSINLFDLSGKNISTIYEGKCNKGSTNFSVSAKNLASGSYLIYINVNDIGTKRLLYHVK